MSKIYQALEKAERERERESKKDLFPVSQIQTEEKKGIEEKRSDLPGAAGISSDQRLVSLFQS